MYQIVTLLKRREFNPMFLVNQPAEMREQRHAAGEPLLTSRIRRDRSWETNDGWETAFRDVLSSQQ